MLPNLRKAPRDPRKDPRRARAKPSERVRGSDKNKPGSAGTKGGAITLSEKQEEWIQEQVREHNAEHRSKSKRVTATMLKKVMRRGMGAFSSTHHPSMSRDGWGRARVRHFLYLVEKGKPRNERYVQDNDLLPVGHPRRSQKKNEGDMQPNAKWSRAYINDLPDSAFAYIDPKDGSRHLPYKNHLGNVDPAHTRNALARLNQVKDLPKSKEPAVRRKLERALESVGGYQSNHDLDYEKAMEIVNAELAEGGDAYSASKKVYQAFKRRNMSDKELSDLDAFSQGVAVLMYEQMQERRRATPHQRYAAGSRMGSHIQRLEETDPFYKWRGDRPEWRQVPNQEMHGEEEFAALVTRLGPPLEAAKVYVTQGYHPDQATQIAGAQFGLTPEDTQVLHYAMDGYSTMSGDYVMNSHHENRAALDIGSKAVFYGRGDPQVVTIVGYQSGVPIVSDERGSHHLIPISDLSHDVYEMKVAEAMTMLMGGMDPAEVVGALQGDPEVSEEFALSAMEDAARRVREAS